MSWMCCASSWSTLECLQIWWTHTHTHTHLCYYHITESQTSIQGYQCAYQWHFLARSYFLCLCHLLCSWFQCGTVSCAVSIAALWGWLGPTSHWHLNLVSTFRYPFHFSSRLNITTQIQSNLLWWFCLLTCNNVFLHEYNNADKENM